MYTSLRHHLIALLALCLLAACSSDAPDDNGGAGNGKGVEMLFSATDAASAASRVAATTDLCTQGSVFTVFGDRKSGSTSVNVIFNGDNVSYDPESKEWSYANVRYWLPDEEHSFVAVHPAGATGISDTQYSGSTLSFNLTLPADYRSNPDLLVAAHRRMYEELSSPFEKDPQAYVRFSFNHVMSRINFKVKNEGAAQEVKIKKIELQGINRTGTFTVTPAPLSSGGDRTDDHISSWTGIANKGDLIAALDVNIPDTEVRDLFPDNNALFMIPQPDNKDVITRITYDLYDDGKKHDEDYTLIAQEPIGGWQPGKMYTYTLDIKPLQSNVSMTLSVSDWLMGAENNVDVPRK